MKTKINNYLVNASGYSFFRLTGHIRPTPNTASSSSNSSDEETTLTSLNFVNDEDRADEFSSGNGNKTTTISEVSIDKKASEIIRLVLSDDFVPGEITRTQLFLEKLAKTNKLLFEKAFQRSWLKLYSNQNEYHLYNFICIASCLEYCLLNDYGKVLVLAGLSHKSDMVKEAAIRAVESWDAHDLVSTLEKTEVLTTDWLEEYRLNVIKDLKG